MDWRVREFGASAVRSARGRACILMACSDMSEADQTGRLLEQVKTGCLVTYRRAQDLLKNMPAGWVALVILATYDSPAVLSQTLKWLRRRCPGCPVTVIADAGEIEREMAARTGGALYLTRPVASRDLSEILSRALARVAPCGRGQPKEPPPEEADRAPTAQPGRPKETV